MYSPDASCQFEHAQDFSGNGVEYPPGRYTVRVTASDGINEPTEKKFSFAVSPELLDREPDRLGLENWWQFDSTETGADTGAHVNASNGNLVWHSTPIVNAGRGLSTVVNLTYNSQRRKPLPLAEGPIEQVLGGYDEVGAGFSMGVSGITRLNERMNVDLAPVGRITLTDPDGTRHQFKGVEGLEGEVFEAPPGVQLHLRRFSPSALPIDAPLFGFERLTDPDKAWAATRPDGVTHYFDQQGYQTSIEDRTGNVLRFVYEFRGPTRQACQAQKDLNLNLFVLPGKICPYKLTKVIDPGGQDDLLITYKARAAAEIPPELVPEGAQVPTVEQEGSESGRVASITHGNRSMRFVYEGDRLVNTHEADHAPSDTRGFGFGYEQHEATSPLKIRPLTSVTDPRGSKTEIFYKANSNGLDSASELLTFDRPVERIVDRAESPAGPSARATTYAYDSATRTTVVSDTRDEPTRDTSTTFKLDERGRLDEMVDARGTTTTLAWDDETTSLDDNQVTEMREAANDPAETALTTMKYNPNGLLTSRIDYPDGPAAAGRETELEYLDHAGHATHKSPRTTSVNATQTSLDNVDASREKEFVSDLDTVTDPRGGVTDFDYQAGQTGNITARIEDIDADSEAQTTFVPGEFGLVQSSTDPVGKTTQYEDYIPTVSLSAS